MQPFLVAKLPLFFFSPLVLNVFGNSQIVVSYQEVVCGTSHTKSGSADVYVVWQKGNHFAYSKRQYFHL